MKQEELEKVFDEFVAIGNNIAKINSQYGQFQAHIKLYSAFFERLYDAGYKQGQKDKLLKNEVRISKSN